MTARVNISPPDISLSEPSAFAVFVIVVLFVVVRESFVDIMNFTLLGEFCWKLKAQCYRNVFLFPVGKIFHSREKRFYEDLSNLLDKMKVLKAMGSIFKIIKQGYQIVTIQFFVFAFHLFSVFDCTLFLKLVCLLLFQVKTHYICIDIWATLSICRVFQLILNILLL